MKAAPRRRVPAQHDENMPPRQIRPLLVRDLLVNAEDIKQLAKTVRHLHRKPLPTDPWPKEQEGSGKVPRRLREWMLILRRLSATLEYHKPSNGLPTPPATQQSASAADARPEGTGNRTRQYNQNASPARPPNDRRTTCDELFLAARKDYLDPQWSLR
ncbi:hypothetical protein R3P38DRAFT_3185256 [Favolaschia claudopus]|uniref:Uncharacterized protein n=1 Tax=Favolaschia claudopus TaxID=2862362 RepID=A0AAW0C7A2_9AGAR